MNHGDHHYFVMHTDNVLADEAFFSRLLGWELTGGELTNVAFFGALSDHHPRAIWVHVDDCAAAVARVAELGGEPGEITEEGSGLNATCRDDQGNTFHMGTLIEAYRNHPHPDPLPTGELGYFTLPVGDPDRAVEFYGPLFGWTFDAPGTSGTHPDYRHCNSGTLPFGFTAEGDISPDLYFRIDDAHGSRSRVTGLGGTHGDIVDSETGPSLTACESPGGVRFNLWQPADGY
ncbi:MAG: VOC family protein [Microthrixaceae bacterium]